MDNTEAVTHHTEAVGRDQAVYWVQQESDGLSGADEEGLVGYAP